MGGMSSAHPTHFFTCAFLWRMIRVVGRASGVRTKVLSKDEWVKNLLSIPCRGVVDYVVVAHRVRLLVMLIVACRSRLVLAPSGGARVKQKRVAHGRVRCKWTVSHRKVMKSIILQNPYFC